MAVHFKCSSCGGDLDFDPGTEGLKCPYCGSENAVSAGDAYLEELDYRARLEQGMEDQESEERLTSRCRSCGAETTFGANVTSADCPFCGTNVVLSGTSTKVIKPKGVLPFKISLEKASAAFRKWVKSRWFAPDKLKALASVAGGIKGVYVPYWTYDCTTSSAYTGERGDAYTTRERVTVRENGRQLNRTREVKKVRWTPARGTVNGVYDDVLVAGSNSLPLTYAERLEPWDLDQLQPYADDFLSGFRAESYKIGLDQGFETAKQIIDGRIADAVRHHIGGDEQRVHSVSSRYEAITFKHVLLPIWISAYRYQGEVYRFLVNGRTGEVQGERPYSWIKIAAAIAAGLACLACLVYLAS